MPKFKFAGVTADGTIDTGVIKAEDAGSAKSELKARSLKNIELSRKRSILQFEITKEKVKPRDLFHFSRQMAAFVKAGVPIIEALRTFRDETSHNYFRKVISEMMAAIEAGSTLSKAASAYPTVFPTYYVGLLQAAELSGHLDSILDQLADYLDREIDARQKIKGALLYPIIVLFLALITIGTLTIFVLPRFKTFFGSLDAELPLATRMLLAITNFLVNWWWLLIVLTVTAVLAFYYWQRTPKGRLKRDQWLLSLPAFGEVLKYAIIERFCRVLAAMSSAGIPLPQAMSVVIDTTGNTIYRNGITKAREQMLEGQGLATPISNTKLFPSAMTQMIRVGEETGTLDDQLEHSAQYFERELDFKIKTLTGVFEPAVLIFVGVVVGFVAIALVSAMYGIFRQNVT